MEFDRLNELFNISFRKHLMEKPNEPFLSEKSLTIPIPDELYKLVLEASQKESQSPEEFLRNLLNEKKMENKPIYHYIPLEHFESFAKEGLFVKRASDFHQDDWDCNTPPVNGKGSSLEAGLEKCKNLVETFGFLKFYVKTVFKEKDILFSGGFDSDESICKWAEDFFRSRPSKSNPNSSPEYVEKFYSKIVQLRWKNSFVSCFSWSGGEPQLWDRRPIRIASTVEKVKEAFENTGSYKVNSKDVTYKNDDTYEKELKEIRPAGDSEEFVFVKRKRFEWEKEHRFLISESIFHQYSIQRLSRMQPPPHIRVPMKGFISEVCIDTEQMDAKDIESILSIVHKNLGLSHEKVVFREKSPINWGFMLDEFLNDKPNKECTKDSL